MPDRRIPDRRFRFSLMALLGAMTLAAVVLASIDWTPPLDNQFLGVAVRPDGLVIFDVLPGTTAALCALQPGDEILAFNSVSVSDIHELRRQLARYEIAHPVTVTFQRDGQEQTVGPFPLSARPGDLRR
jgi:S1-C subfamily serine protease